MKPIVGFLHHNVRTGVFVILIVIPMLVSGCKATSTLVVSMGQGTSGTLLLKIVLDQEASSVIGSKSYKPIDLKTIFNTDVLASAGFKVKVHEVNKGSSFVEISSTFNNEKELNRALSVFAPSGVLSSSIDEKKSLIKDNVTTSVTVDLTNLKEMYLNNEKILDSIHEAGITDEEFSGLINSAFDSTELRVELKSEDQTKSMELIGKTPIKKTVDIQTSQTNIRFIASTLLAIMAIMGAIVVFIRSRRRSPLLLNDTQTSQEENG